LRERNSGEHFAVHPTQKGPTNGEEVAQIEDFLIQAGITKNPRLQNIRGAQQPNWNIKGVVWSGSGKRNGVETQFASLFDIRSK
jgi:hypothetical protein